MGDSKLQKKLHFHFGKQLDEGDEGAFSESSLEQNKEKKRANWNVLPEELYNFLPHFKSHYDNFQKKCWEFQEFMSRREVIKTFS